MTNSKQVSKSLIRITKVKHRDQRMRLEKLLWMTDIDFYKKQSISISLNL